MVGSYISTERTHGGRAKGRRREQRADAQREESWTMEGLSEQTAHANKLRKMVVVVTMTVTVTVMVMVVLVVLVVNGGEYVGEMADGGEGKKSKVAHLSTMASCRCRFCRRAIM
jgi:heme/copper-type cytochrome/quinol oxidase subunit 2